MDHIKQISDWIKAFKIRLASPLLKEWRFCLALMGPIYVGQVAQMLMTTTDTIMAGQLSPNDLAAVSLGNGLWIPCFLFAVGLIGALQPVLAHAFGASNFAIFKPVLLRGSVIVGVLSCLFVILLRFSELGFSKLDTDPLVSQQAAAYLRALSWGIPALFFMLLLRSLCEGLGKPSIMTYLYLLMAAINVPLNFIFMYGYWGGPALGGVGCGYASSLSNWLGLIIFAIYLWSQGGGRLRIVLGGSGQLKPMDSVLTQSQQKPMQYDYKALLRLGLPMGMHLFVEGLTFAGIVFLVAPLGSISVAANQIGLNIIGVIFMLPLSLGLSMSIRVAYLRGAQQFELARELARSTLAPIFILSVLATVFILFQSPLIVKLYTHDPQVIDLTVSLLFWAALFQFSDMAQVVWTSTLRGMHDTLPAFIIFVFSCWGVGIPLGYILARTDLIFDPLGAEGFWIGILVALTLAMMALWWRLWRVSNRFTAPLT